MGCIRSKPVHRQDENEDGYVFDDVDEIQSTGFKLDIVEEIKSFEKIGIGGAVAVLDLGAGETESDADDNKHEEKSVDDYALAKRMQLLRDVAELQMTQLRLARDRFHWSIIQRDARRVVASLKSHPFYDEESEDIQTNGEVSLTGNDATELKEAESKDKSPAKEAAIWLLDVVLNNVDYDAQKVEEDDEQEEEQEQEGEEKCDDKDTEVPDFGYFQEEDEDTEEGEDKKDDGEEEEREDDGEEDKEEKDEEKKEEGEEDEGEEKSKEKKENEEKDEEEMKEEEEKEEEDDEEFECDDNDTHLPDFGYFQFQRLDQTWMTTRRHSRLPPPSSVNIDQPIEKQRLLLDDYNNLNSPDQVHSHDITTDLNQSQPNDEESSIDEGREKRRALAHRLGLEPRSPEFENTALPTELSRLPCRTADKRTAKRD
ncbi:FK506-binding protein 5-like [Strongylocentrotus purpuratus]|uniref:Uncharacterized protein n=1 Tax=Strongylocentrotus purpuratus TaxID=7668 RepID=A0A7M7NY42_STRPU|nr:FK506-binding protein 5-like [Strongylocentrotus purpuratus]